MAVDRYDIEAAISDNIQVDLEGAIDAVEQLIEGEANGGDIEEVRGEVETIRYAIERAHDVVSDVVTHIDEAAFALGRIEDALSRFDG